MAWMIPKNVSTRLAEPNHKEWEPRQHQVKGRDFLLGTACAALFFSPGLGKTSCVLAAFSELLGGGQARRALVVAPLRVCQLVWRQEAEKWTQFRGLRFALLHGRGKEKALGEEADIYLINPEGLPWLLSHYPLGKALPFDTLVLDELTRFKNSQGKRYKQFRKYTGHFRRRWGLTGTPAANGYMDLFGQMLILDDGASLGKYITHYRDRYFVPDFLGYNWELRRGAKEEIQQRIAPYVLHMRTEDCVDVPEVVDHVHQVELPAKARQYYKSMEKTMLAQLTEGVVEAANTGATYNKLKQMANGNVYTVPEGEHERHTLHVHDAKVDALADLIEELGDEQLLVAYEFQHDLALIRSKLGADIPHLGKGVNEKKATETVAAWNRGEIPVLLAHPASAGHGLNMQESHAWNVCWFSPTWNYEYYDQFIDRVARSGNEASKVVNHLLVARHTIDEVVLQALVDKYATQAELLARLATEIHPHAAGDDAVSKKEVTMTRKLKGKTNPWGGGAHQADMPETEDNAPQEAAGEDTETPKGWGKAAGSAASSEQRKKIAGKLSGDHGAQEDGEAPSGLAAFSDSIRSSFAGAKAADEPPAQEDNSAAEEKPKKRAKSAAKSGGKKAAPAEPDKAEQTVDYEKLADALLGRVQVGSAPQVDMEELAAALLRRLGERLRD